MYIIYIHNYTGTKHYLRYITVRKQCIVHVSYNLIHTCELPMRLCALVSTLFALMSHKCSQSTHKHSCCMSMLPLHVITGVM